MDSLFCSSNIFLYLCADKVWLSYLFMYDFKLEKTKPTFLLLDNIIAQSKN